MSVRKRKVLNIEEKSRIISKLESGIPNKILAKEYSVSHSTISTIWKQRKIIQTLFNNNYLKMKRARLSGHTRIEKALLQWFKHNVTNNVPVNGPILQQKANDYAQSFGEDFVCSSSWIQRFRARHGIVGGKTKSEAAIVDSRVDEEWFLQKDIGSGSTADPAKIEFASSNIEELITSEQSLSENDSTQDPMQDTLSIDTDIVKTEVELTATQATEFVSCEEPSDIRNKEIKLETDDAEAGIVTPDVVMPTSTSSNVKIKQEDGPSDSECDLFAQNLGANLKTLEKCDRLGLMNEIDRLVFKYFLNLKSNTQNASLQMCP